MRRRIYSAVLAIIALIVLLYLGGWVLDAAIILLAGMGLAELSSLFAQKGIRMMMWLSFLALVFMALGTIYGGVLYGFWAIFIASMIGISMPVFTNSYNAADAQATVFSLIYPSAGFMFLIAANHLVKPMNSIALISAMLFAWGCDSGAYFSGVWWGKRALCPRISPKKTVEGSIGGMIVAVLSGVVFGMIVYKFFYRTIPWYDYIIIAVLSGLISQLGDLSASAIKRYYGVKDFGNFMPGHGGVLDRFDSLLYVMPMVYLYIEIVLGRFLIH